MSRGPEAGEGRTDGGNDIDRSGEAVGPVDAEVVAEGADEQVYQSRDFPGGGGAGGAGRGDSAASGGGSTGRNATDSGKTDAEGTAGGGMAGSSGG